MESMRLWVASLVMASEWEIRPMMMLKTASKKLVRIKSQPAFLITWLRDFAGDFSGLFTLSILAYF